MIFQDTPLPGVVIVEPEMLADERGAFARTFCAEEFEARGLDPRVAQTNISLNARAGTLRGMHYQAAPHGEAKLVRVTRGAIYDVAIDLREGSPTRLRWFGTELTAENRRALHIPAGCAHGFQSLRDDTEVLYLMSTPYVPGAGRGVRWNDPAFAVEWPAPPPSGRTMSERDATYPDFDA
ncbi:MAG TPA: dTDP-4-dehydrorhamnose 3,5-epimerase [Solirubrobacteraceae bacterium]|nr:dTDP-4-dehydrorhamnose 3,5-epimerase [Solirubrobacteraceae bacterium]